MSRGFYDGMRDEPRRIADPGDHDGGRAGYYRDLELLRGMLDLGLRDPELFDDDEKDRIRAAIRSLLFSGGPQ